MTRFAILMAILFATSCTNAVQSPNNSSSTFPKKHLSPIDANSAFGKIKIDEQSLIVEQDEFNANLLVSIIEKQTKNIAAKQFFLIDVQSKEQSSAQEFARISDEALKKINLNYEIKVKSGNELNNREGVLVRLRSIRIQPRDCSPTNADPREILGSYYETKFGCSYANNMAAIIDNPRDTVAPRGNAFFDTYRAMKVLRSYLDGEPTSATRSENEAGDASEVSLSD